MEQHVQLARSLHPRLLHFFKRFPPPQLATATTTTAPQQQPQQQQTPTIQISSTTSSSDPNAAATSTPIPASQTTPSTHTKLNPFIPFRNPRTGIWHGPHYSLRRQADLFKLAIAYNVLPLMPEGPKHPEIKEQKRIENGLRVQGTGVGKKVKGKLWERTLKGRLDERRKAMEGMPEMIRQWKERGHGRGWRKWPK